MNTCPRRHDAIRSLPGNPSMRLVACGTALFAAATTLAGCYERVVDASGPTASTVNIQPSERSDTWLDRAVFPEKGREESAFGSSTAERQRAYMRQNKAN